MNEDDEVDDPLSFFVGLFFGLVCSGTLVTVCYLAWRLLK